MYRWLFPIALILVLVVVALTHWGNGSHASGDAIGSTRSPAREASPNPGGDAGAPTAPVPQTNGGSGQP